MMAPSGKAGRLCSCPSPVCVLSKGLEKYQNARGLDCIELTHRCSEGDCMKSDTQLKADVTEELEWNPAINATNIGVMVKDGLVTLAGHLDTFAEKHAVERAVRRVAGVRGIALDLDVKLAKEHKRSDSEVAQAAIMALRLNSLVPDGKVKVEVEDGWVTLTGEVDWS